MRRLVLCATAAIVVLALAGGISLLAERMLARDVRDWRAALAQNGISVAISAERESPRLFGAQAGWSTLSLLGANGAAVRAENVHVTLSLLHPRRVTLSTDRLDTSALGPQFPISATARDMTADITRTASVVSVAFRAAGLTVARDAAALRPVPSAETTFAHVAGHTDIQLHPTADSTRAGVVFTADSGSLSSLGAAGLPIPAATLGTQLRHISLTLALVTPVDTAAGGPVDRILVQEAAGSAGSIAMLLRGALRWPQLDGDMTVHLTGLRTGLQEAIDHPPAAVTHGDMPEVAALLTRLRNESSRLPDSLDFGTTVIAGRPNIDIPRLAKLLTDAQGSLPRTGP